MAAVVSAAVRVCMVLVARMEVHHLLEINNKGAGVKSKRNTRRFTDEWLKKEGDLSETRRRKRERDAAEGQAFAKRGRTDGGDKREEGYGGAQGQRGSEVGVAQHNKKKQSKANLRGGRSGKPVGRNGGAAAAKDVGQKQLGTAVPVAGGMSATEESKREQADLVARHVCDCGLFPFRSPASSLLGGLFVVFVYERIPSVFVPSLSRLIFYFIFCLSSIDHIVTGPSPWFAFALVC
ncbi:unnamed protein product, partial [Pylaiella littoralis]